MLEKVMVPVGYDTCVCVLLRREEGLVEAKRALHGENLQEW